eukprot:6194332-Pleurochrysis_carterae.AAC.6
MIPTERILRAAGSALSAYATYEVEYSRVYQDDPSTSVGGWPASALDVFAALAALERSPQSEHLDLSNVWLIGHSAGGQVHMTMLRLVSPRWHAMSV